MQLSEESQNFIICNSVGFGTREQDISYGKISMHDLELGEVSHACCYLGAPSREASEHIFGGCHHGLAEVAPCTLC